MADKEDKKKNNEEKKKTENKPDQPKNKTSLLTWIIMAVIVITLTASGFVVGRLFAGPASTQQIESNAKEAPNENSKAETSDHSKEASKELDAAAKTDGTWYYDLDPIVANLNEPGAMRYVRVSITLQINSSWEKEKAENILELQKPNLKNWLAIYLASLTTNDATGDKNLKRIQLEILDAFNGILFPDAKPQIKQVLFKEGLAIQ